MRESLQAELLRWRNSSARLTASGCSHLVSLVNQGKWLRKHRGTCANEGDDAQHRKYIITYVVFGRIGEEGGGDRPGGATDAAIACWGPLLVCPDNL